MTKVFSYQLLGDYQVMESVESVESVNFFPAQTYHKAFFAVKIVGERLEDNIKKVVSYQLSVRYQLSVVRVCI